MFELRQQISNLCTHLTTIHDHVDCAMIQKKLAALKAFWQLLPHRLFDDARAGETDQRIGLSDIHIAEHRKAGGYATGRRVSEYRYERHTFAAQTRLTLFPFNANKVPGWTLSGEHQHHSLQLFLS